jgi:hypothetical protein
VNQNQETPLPHVDLDELSDLAKLKDIKIVMEFIRALEGATLEGTHSHLDDDTLEHLRNPPRGAPEGLNNPDLCLGLDLFLSTINTAQKTYVSAHNAILRHHPDDNILSYKQMKQHIAEITGVVLIVHNMCKNSCLAYTGPFAELPSCPECGELWYDSSGAVKQEFHTMPLGPQLQALYRDSQNAQNIPYWHRHTEEIIRELHQNNRGLESFGDFFHG